MLLSHLLPLLCAIVPAIVAQQQYQLAQQYAGQTFFDRWGFYGSYDNLTNGDVVFVDRANASSQRLAYVNDAGHAIMRIDNTSFVPWNEKRNSVRIESVDSYSIGSLFIIDMNHIPYGCSVWPAFWTMGPDWPEDGEIDIVEQINVATQNQVALHTKPGCIKRAGAVPQTGIDGDGDCGTVKGCTVNDPSRASFGAPFAAAGGGVWATQFDTTGIFVWFWSRPDVPSALVPSTAPTTVDPRSWGPPVAAYPAADCKIDEYFGPQRLVLTITLCGDWAGTPAVYNSSSCYQSAGPNGVCYLDNVINEGSPQYDTAYFDINHIRVYTLPGATVSSVGASGTGGASASQTVPGSGAAQTNEPNAAITMRLLSLWSLTSGVAVVVIGTLVCM